jgi:hypothetical protein
VHATIDHQGHLGTKPQRWSGEIQVDDETLEVPGVRDALQLDATGRQIIHRLLLLTLTALLALAASASAAYDGKVQFFCPPGGMVQADPLAGFGVSPSPHMHTVAGAAGVFSAKTTLAQLTETNGDPSQTTCDLGSDHSLIWMPTPYRADGTPATIITMSYYLINSVGFTVDPAQIPLYNPGLRFLAGAPDCTSRACVAKPGGFTCEDVSPHTHFVTVPTPAQCPPGGPNNIEEDVYSAGQCWNPGPGLGEGFGGSGGPAAFSLPASAPCPGGDATVPREIFVLHLQAYHGGQPDFAGGYLSSDFVPSEGLDQRTTCPGCTAHADYAFDFAGNALSLIVQDCFGRQNWPQQALTCGESPIAKPSTIFQEDPATKYPEDGQIHKGIQEPYSPVTS